MGSLTEPFLSAALLANNQQLKSKKLPVEFQVTEEGIVSLAPKRKPKGVTLRTLSEVISQESLDKLSPGAFQTFFIALLTQMDFSADHCYQILENGEFDVSGYLVRDFIPQNVRCVISRSTDSQGLPEKAFQLQKDICLGQLGIFMIPGVSEEQLSVVKLPSYPEGIIILGQKRLCTLLSKYGLLK